MSRTRKDEPSFVKARKKGTVSHDFSCLDYSQVNVRTNETTEIFYAHEVEKMKLLEADLAESGDSFTVKEQAGFLVTKLSESGYRRYAPYSPFIKLTLPRRVLVDAERRHPNFYSEPYLDLVPAYSNHTVSDFNVFYVYTVTRSKTLTKGWGPRGQQESQNCCTPDLALRFYGGCSCCKYDDPDRTGDSRSQSRDKMKASAKTFNYGGLTAFDDFLQPEDEPLDLLPRLVYTSETPGSVRSII
jgi:hypothetical protein